MRINRCVKKDFGYVGCGRDVMNEIDSQCSGRRACRVRVLDESFPKTQPCHEDLKSYLQVTYKCIKGKWLNLCHANIGRHRSQDRRRPGIYPTQIYYNLDGYDTKPAVKIVLFWSLWSWPHHDSSPANQGASLNWTSQLQMYSWWAGVCDRLAKIPALDAVESARGI